MWIRDFRLAQDSGIDAFVLNFDPSFPDALTHLLRAYDAAHEDGRGFKLALSLDLAGQQADPHVISALIARFIYHPAALYYRQRPFVTTFAGVRTPTTKPLSPAEPDHVRRAVGAAWLDQAAQALGRQALLLPGLVPRAVLGARALEAARADRRPRQLERCLGSARRQVARRQRQAVSGRVAQVGQALRASCPFDRAERSAGLRRSNLLLPPPGPQLGPLGG